MDEAKFFEVLEDLFELEPGEVNGETPLQQVPGWDSLTFLGLIARVDEEFGVTLAPEAVLACATLADLQALIETKANKMRAA